jgi:hypothetical protein
MLEFFFMNIDGHISANEVLQPARMIQMQVAHDDCCHVLDVVSGCFDSRW